MRVLNRLLSLLLGATLLVAGLLIATGGALALAGRPPWPITFDHWYDTLTTTRFTDPAVIAASAAVGVLGLGLVVAQLRRWAPQRVGVAPATDGSQDWWVVRRTAEQHLAETINAVTGVERARVRLRGRPSRWRVLATASARPDARAEVEAVLKEALDTLAAPDPTGLRVSLRKPRRVA